MNKHYCFKYMSVVIVALSFVVTSCNQKEDYDFDGGTEAVFVSSPTATNVNSKPNTFVGVINKTPIAVFGEVSAKFPVRSTIPAKNTIEVTLGIDNDLVKQFNEKNGTNYAALSADLVAFKNNPLTIEKGQYLSKDSVSVSIPLDNEKIAQLEVKDYIIPIAIKKVNGGLGISQNMNVVYLLLKMKEDADNIYDIVPTDKGTLLSSAERNAWTVVTNNSSFNVNTSVLFDGNLNNNISYTISSLTTSTSFIVDMKRIYPSLSGINIYFYSSRYNLKKADVYSSQDNSTWTLEGNVTNSNGTWDLIFYKNVSARYLKFVPIEVSSSGVYMKEFNVYTK